MLSNHNMKKTDTTFWDERRGKIRTKIGGLVVSKNAVYSHGYSILDDLMGKTSYFQLLILNATGRMPEPRLADWVEAFFHCASYPDSRIWCNYIGSLAGTMRTTPVAAICAGILASDSRMYGAGITNDCVSFIVDALIKKKNGMSAEEIVESHPRRRPDFTPMICGYSRPVFKGDERVAALERVTTQLGFERGEHLSLAYEIRDIMLRKYNEHMNSGGFRSAFLCDQGFTLDEIYRIVSILVNTGVTACYAESFDNPPESFLPMRCDDMDYQGNPPRSVPM